MPSTEKMFEKFTSEVQRTNDQPIEIEVVQKKSQGRAKKGHKRSMSNETSTKQSQKSATKNHQANEKSWRVQLPFKRAPSPQRSSQGAQAKREAENQKTESTKQ